jgi:hypothetical protein
MTEVASISDARKGLSPHLRADPFKGQSLLIWPCFLQRKHRPFLIYSSTSACGKLGPLLFPLSTPNSSSVVDSFDPSIDPNSIGVDPPVVVGGVLELISPRRVSCPQSFRRINEFIGVLEGYRSLLFELDGGVSNSYLMTIQFDMASVTLFTWVRGMRSRWRSGVSP